MDVARQTDNKQPTDDGPLPGLLRPPKYGDTRHLQAVSPEPSSNQITEGWSAIRTYTTPLHSSDELKNENSERRSTKLLPIFFGVVANLGKHSFIVTIAAQLVPVLVPHKPLVVVVSEVNRPSKPRERVCFVAE
jgi:hypothetical protein